MLRWSMLRAAVGNRNFATKGQLGDGREAAAADYVVARARPGDPADALAKLDEFAYRKSFLVNVGDEKGRLLDAAVRRADPRLVLELGTYCGYGALRMAVAAREATVVSVELAEANAVVARRIWQHAGVRPIVVLAVAALELGVALFLNGDRESVGDPRPDPQRALEVTIEPDAARNAAAHIERRGSRRHREVDAQEDEEREVCEPNERRDRRQQHGDQAAQQQREAELRRSARRNQRGTSIESRIDRRTASVVPPSTSSAGSSSTRCRSAGRNTRLMSSGST